MAVVGIKDGHRHGRWEEVDKSPVRDESVWFSLILLGVENERADAGRDGRTNSQAREGTGGKNNPCSADLEQDWEPKSGGSILSVC